MSGCCASASATSVLVIRAEQTARAAALGGNDDSHVLHPVGNLERFGALLGLTLLRGLVVHFHRIHVVGGRFLRELLREEEVSGVTVGNFDHLAALAFAADVLR